MVTTVTYILQRILDILTEKIMICNKINVYNYTFCKTNNIIGKVRKMIFSNYLTHSVMMLVFYLGIRSNCNLRKKIFEHLKNKREAALTSNIFVKNVKHQLL